MDALGICNGTFSACNAVVTAVGVKMFIEHAKAANGSAYHINRIKNGGVIKHINQLANTRPRIYYLSEAQRIAYARNAIGFVTIGFALIACLFGYLCYKDR